MNSFSFYSVITISLASLCFIGSKYAVERNMYYVFGIGLFLNLLWCFCVKYTNRIVFDSILYDVLIAVFYTASLIWFGAEQGCNWYNWIGFSLILIGLVLFKL